MLYIVYSVIKSSNIFQLSHLLLFSTGKFLIGFSRGENPTKREHPCISVLNSGKYIIQNTDDLYLLQSNNEQRYRRRRRGRCRLRYSKDFLVNEYYKHQ